MFRFAATVALSVLLAAPAWASDLRVQNVWARATAPGQAVAGVYMDLRADRPLSLVGGTSPAAERLELHTMAMQEGVMVMRRVPEINVPAGQTVSLKPGGLHVMLIGLKAPLKEGQSVPLTLQVRDAAGQVKEMQVEAQVRRERAGGMQHAH
jgi:copper(I)-binding protein